MGALAITCTSMVDLDRYPVTDLQSTSAQALIARVQADLSGSGACELQGFLTPVAVQCAVEECAILKPEAFTSRTNATAYLTSADSDFPERHARTFTMKSSVGVVGYDQIPLSNSIRQLYEWPPLMEFIARTLDVPHLYHYADPLGALNLAVMGDGDRLGWHFDQTDFVVSIPLVSALEGGEFEVYPLLRSANQENYAAVTAAVTGTSTPPTRFPMNPGSLLLFKGRHSLHRVTRISGAKHRVVALLAYDTQPDTNSTTELKLARYGRTQPLTAI
ncbi:MAG: hypothetical protein O3A63_16715 [Proteobacteria bacterium]|nr:hypothetical protein [Pseudomonadota bacterium]